MRWYREKKTYNVDKASLFLIIFIITFFVIKILTAFIFELTPQDHKQNLLSTLSSLVAPITSILSIYMVCNMQKTKFKETCLVKKFNPLYVIVAFFISVGMFLGLGFVNNTVAWFLIENGLSFPSIDIDVSRIGDLIIYTITFAIFPAVFEELFFRGVLLHGREKISVSLIMFLALSFAVYHSSAVQLVYQFIYGALLVFLAISSGSVLPGMIAHFLNNFAVILFTYLKFNIDLSSPITIVIGLCMLTIAISIMFSLGGAKKLKKGEKGETSRFLFPLGMIFIGLYAIIIMLGLFV